MIEEEPSLVACIPAYNEERSIAGVVVRSMKYADRVVVRDDGSVDLMGEIAKGLGNTSSRDEDQVVSRLYGCEG